MWAISKWGPYVSDTTANCIKSGDLFPVLSIAVRLDDGVLMYLITVGK
jgi:hypothetical protein